MSESSFDVPLADPEELLERQDEDATPAEGEPLPEEEPDFSRDAANEADLLEQSVPVEETEDYPYGPADE
jgi:hypothetical protein